MREALLDRDTSRQKDLTEYRITADSADEVRYWIFMIVRMFDEDIVEWHFDMPCPIGRGLYESYGYVRQGLFEPDKKYLNKE